MSHQLHIIPDIAICSGGMGFAAIRHAESLSKAGAYVTVFAATTSNESLIKPTGSSRRFRLVHAPSSRLPVRGHIDICTGMNRLFQESQYELIHLHGLWRPIHVIAAVLSQYRQVPFVISPHGCLEDWAIRQKWIRKNIALKTYQGLVNLRAAMFFATSDQEVQSLRKIGISQPIATIPIGIDLEHLSLRVNQTQRRSMLFLSRLHPGKGLLDLVEAWRGIRNENWRIVIAGPDVNGHRLHVQKMIHQYGLEKDFEFMDRVGGKKKQRCFESANLFILPSYSENFGISILEALANQLPVITTTRTPWRDIQERHCGWWVEPGVAGISAAMQEAMAMPRVALEAMGQRGRQLVEEKYSWNMIAQNSLHVYEWLLGRTSCRPTSVSLHTA